MDLKINWDGGVFAVPDCAADGLKLASGKAVKVLFYILKFKTDDGIKDYLQISEEDLEDALSYWQNVGVLYADGEKPAVKVSTESPAAEKKQPVLLPEPSKTMSAGEIAEKLNENSEMRSLFESIQVSLGRHLSFSDQSTLVWIFEHLGLSSEVILMLVNYCVSIKRGNMRYIEKAAVSWADEGIDSISAADAKILALQKSNAFSEQCSRRMNLNRGLTEKERGFAEKWSAAGADIDLIMNAFERTLDSTGKVSFPYMNKILVKWLDNGIRTCAEADRFSEATAPVSRSRAELRPKSENTSFDAALSDIIELSKTTPIIP